MRPCEAPCLKERDVIGLVNLSNSQMRHKQIKKRRRRIKPLQSSCSSSWSSRDESLHSAARLRLLAVHPRVTVHIKNARNNLRCAGRRRGERISQFSKDDEAAAQKNSETERDAVQTSSCKKKGEVIVSLPRRSRRSSEPLILKSLFARFFRCRREVYHFKLKT